jgi:hypothetical protein
MKEKVFKIGHLKESAERYQTMIRERNIPRRIDDETAGVPVGSPFVSERYVFLY